MKDIVRGKHIALDANEKEMMDAGLAEIHRMEAREWRSFPAKISRPVSGIETKAGQLRIFKEERLLQDINLPLEGFDAKVKGLVVTLRQDSSDEKFIGYAKVYEWSVGYLKGWRSPSYEILKAHGFDTEDTVADLALFYPLFEARELKRNGIATAVMQHIISESKLEGLSGVYVPMATNWGGMREFLDSMGFEKANHEFYLKNFARDQS